MNESDLHARIAELERLIADRDRQIAELRAAVDALLAPNKPPTNIWDQFTSQK